MFISRTPDEKLSEEKKQMIMIFVSHTIVKDSV